VSVANIDSDYQNGNHFIALLIKNKNFNTNFKYSSSKGLQIPWYIRRLAEYGGRHNFTL